MNQEDLAKIQRWIDQISSEIILSEPGTDRSQFPLRDLINSLVEKSVAQPDMAEFNACSQFALAFIEDLLFSCTPYTSAHLDALNFLAAELSLLLKDPARKFSPPQTGTKSTQSSPTQSSVADISQLAYPSKDLDFEETTSLNIAADGDLLKEFCIEANEHLENIEQGVLFLEENTSDHETISSIFRAFHTIKGGSGFLNIVPVNRLAHELENLLDLVREGRINPNGNIITLILDGADVFREFVATAQDQLAGRQPLVPIFVPCRDLAGKVRTTIANPDATPALSDAVQMQSKPSSFLSSASTTTPSAESAPSQKTEQKTAQEPKNASRQKVSASASGMIKVDTRKFDSLMDLVGELVIAQSLIAQDPDLRLVQSRNLLRNMSQLGRITNELQKTAMSLRMMPIRNTFQKMNRLVRDIAGPTGKNVDLILHGEDTEMDRTIVEELADPLLHMVRNSVDHGIEMPADRKAAGKSPVGTLRLSASHVGGNILIEISDDGAGIRPDKVFAKAVERGIIPPDAHLSEKEIYDLIFAPGFSTAEKVTDLSGRGVGMDVVKRNISHLRGKIDIDSSPGQGTSFKIYLPLTLAIIDGLLVSISDQRYIIPTLSVRESFRPTSGMISTVHGKGEMVNVRGKLCPLLRLYDVFGSSPRSTDPTESMVVVVESAHEERCILVDDLLGQQEVVIKSLGDSFKNNRMLAGATILGDGRVGLILDPRALVQIREFNTLAG